MRLIIVESDSIEDLKYILETVDCRPTVVVERPPELVKAPEPPKVRKKDNRPQARLRRKILEIVQKKPGLTTKQIRGKLPKTMREVMGSKTSQILHYLQSSGQVERRGTRGNFAFFQAG